MVNLRKMSDVVQSQARVVPCSHIANGQRNEENRSWHRKNKTEFQSFFFFSCFRGIIVTGSVLRQGSSTKADRIYRDG